MFWNYAKRERLALLNGTRISWGRALVRFCEEEPACRDDPGVAAFHPWTLLWYDSRYPAAGETSHVCGWGLHRRGDAPATLCLVNVGKHRFERSEPFEALFLTDASHFVVEVAEESLR